MDRINPLAQHNTYPNQNDHNHHHQAQQITTDLHSVGSERLMSPTNKDYSGDKVYPLEWGNVQMDEDSENKTKICNQRIEDSQIQPLRCNAFKNSQTGQQANHTEPDTITNLGDQHADNPHSQHEQDDDAFIAYCADSSSVLNNDPTRRCYVNKLYQPLNAQNDTDTPLVEHDDEYLLYQELRFIESSAQELTDERERVLTKILEDDEGDDDHLDDNERQQLEDPLDRLQLTTIIESFDNFPSPPLIDDCHDQDPLISEACSSERPDSTGSINDHSPTSSYSSSRSESMSANYISPDHQQFECNHEDLQLSLNIKNQDQESHFLSPVYNNGSHQHHIQHHQSHHEDNIQLDHNHQYNSQINQDNSSEINCFQVSSSFTTNTPSNMSAANTQLSSAAQPITGCTNSQKQFNNECDVSKKRSLDDDHSSLDESTARTKTARSRTKKRPNTDNQDNKTSKSKHLFTNNNNDVTSTIQNSNLEQKSGRANIQHSNIYKTNEYQQGHINTKSDTYRLTSLLEDTTNDDDDGIFTDTSLKSSGNRRNPLANKYRRRTANARERIRMREINQAFEKLKKVVPVELIQQSVSGDESDRTSMSSHRGGNKSSSSSQNEPVKLTKITTLRLAVSYIAKLTEVLNQHPESSSVNIIERSDGTTGQLRNSITRTTRPKDGPSRAKKRNRNSTKKPVEDAPKVKSSKQVDPIESSLADTTDNKLTASKTVQPTTAEDHQRQQQSILITNTMLNQQTAFVSIPQQHKQQFAAYPNQQHPIMISQTAPNGQERTFVTPVAVAILGIPTTANNQNSNEPHGLQLIGIQNPSQQKLQPAKYQQQTIQTASQSSFNLQLPQQQPQQVTLTLDDINGVSVLRLANALQNGSINSQLQFQPNRHQQIVHQQQQPQILTTTGFNYAYQPLQVSQVQPISNNTTTSIPTTTHRAATSIQLRQDNSNLILNKYNNTNLDNQQANNVVSKNDNNQHANSAPSPTITTTITGINSDCRNFGISQSQSINAVPQHQNSIVAQVNQQQIRIQPASSSVQTILHPNNFITVAPASAQVFHSQTSANNGHNGRAIRTAAGLVYIDQTKIIQTGFSEGQNGGSPVLAKQDEQQINEFEQRSTLIQQQRTNSQDSCENRAPMEQMKFVTQFGSNGNQTQEKNRNEANISQLVASLATSIHPNTDRQSKTNMTGQAGRSDAQRQQPQRTYRFHNYDGNMITNHLYSNSNSNHEKQQQNNQQQQASNKKNNGLQQQSDRVTDSTMGCQRSRQNSLSSICSTTSSSSSSLVSSAPLSSIGGSPTNLPAVTIMVKSPALESNIGGSSSSSSSSTTTTTTNGGSSGSLIMVDDDGPSQVTATVGGS